MRNNSNNKSQSITVVVVVAVAQLMLSNSFITTSFAFSQQQRKILQFGRKIDHLQHNHIQNKCINPNYYSTQKRITSHDSLLNSRNNHPASEEFNNEQIDNCIDGNQRRRQFMTKGLSIIVSSLIFTSTVNVNKVYAVDNELFKKNPLTNSFLEQLRIWEQAEADNIRYNGELERGDAGNKGQVDAYPRLLLPILLISNDIQQLYTILVKTKSTTPNTYTQALTIVNQNQYDKIQFKKFFNAYADNIYFSDPDRANVYLGGGTTPKSIQSLAYLLRNDILTNIENIQVELQYLIKNPIETNEDLILYTTAAYNAMNEYITIIPPNELQIAKEIMKKTK